MKALAWAVICKDGSVHNDYESSFLFLDDDQARDEAGDLDRGEWECGPHRVVTLWQRAREMRNAGQAA